MAGREWLAALKAGDQVIVQQGHYGETLTTVSRLTPTTIIVGHRVFNKTHGQQRGGGEWTTAYLIEPTPALLQQIEAKAARDYLRGVPWTSVSDTDVIELVAHVKGLQAKKKYTTVVGGGQNG